MTTIEWTERTWNPTTGCDRISPGCDHCYALTMAGRLKLMGTAKYQNDGDPRTSGPGFGLTVHPDALDLPLRVKKPTRWFVNSMSDLFHVDVPDDFIEAVLCVMNATKDRHTYQVLTKRPQRMSRLLARVWWDCNGDVQMGDYTADELGLPLSRYYDLADHLPSVHWGTSIELDRYSFRADHLRKVRSKVRFLSLEPLLGPLPSLNLEGIDWVIVGGESGPGARPMHPDWARDIRDGCQRAGVPFFFKQWGAWLPYEPDAQPPFWNGQNGDMIDGHFLPADMGEAEPQHGWVADAWDDVIWHKVGKKNSGRLLDGRTWDEYPKVAA